MQNLFIIIIFFIPQVVKIPGVIIILSPPTQSRIIIVITNIFENEIIAPS